MQRLRASFVIRDSTDQLQTLRQGSLVKFYTSTIDCCVADDLRDGTDPRLKFQVHCCEKLLKTQVTLAKIATPVDT